MRGFRLLLAGAALLVAGSLGADALPAGGPLAGLDVGRATDIVPVQSRRTARCFRRCIVGGRLSCRRADSVEACCRARCRHF
jgi:hypothetical protein